MSPTIRSTREQPDLAPLIARWLAAEFHYPGFPPEPALVEAILSPKRGPPEGHFVLFEGPEPVGMVSLIRHDLLSRPDLSPWLGGLYVAPAWRGRGHGIALVRHAEAFVRSCGVPTLWLYTWTAAALYDRLGWLRVGIEREPVRGIEVQLMRRDLA